MPETTNLLWAMHQKKQKSWQLSPESHSTVPPTDLITLEVAVPQINLVTLDSTAKLLLLATGHIIHSILQGTPTTGRRTDQRGACTLTGALREGQAILKEHHTNNRAGRPEVGIATDHSVPNPQIGNAEFQQPTEASPPGIDQSQLRIMQKKKGAIGACQPTHLRLTLAKHRTSTATMMILSRTQHH
jgi:hypothetical protein